ncbi:MAG: rRNA maturation RNase YbeY [bacterium]|nr:rRNA maturation RNase YbeY [bacterium]
MMEVVNLTKTRILAKKIIKLAELVLRKEKRQGKDLSVVLVLPQKMRQLNKVWRGKNKATNVLAFPGGTEALGEIVLCPLVIRKDALEYKISFQKALSWMFVHGLLHLLGYDHETKRKEQVMIQKEQRYLTLFA